MRHTNSYYITLHYIITLQFLTETPFYREMDDDGLTLPEVPDHDQ